jgi:hypothetical protein
MNPDALSPANRTSPQLAFRRRLDHIGIGLAGLCALHCLLTLAVVSALGLGGHFLLDENIHRIGLVLALALAGLAIGWGVLRHRRMLPLAAAIGGLVLMGAGLLVPHGAKEFLLTLIGVVIVSGAHWLNLRAGR